MKISKKDSYVILYDEGEQVETYSLKEEINFKGLLEHLLKLNLQTKKYLGKFEEKDFTPEEMNLIKIIKDIIDTYTLKCQEFEDFVNQQKQKPEHILSDDTKTKW